MIPRPSDEPLRLAALHNYMLLDTQADDAFDLLTELAAELCGVPYSFVSLVDEDRVWFKSRCGGNAEQLPRDQDYCAWSILEDKELNIPDLTADSRTANMTATTSGQVRSGISHVQRSEPDQCRRLPRRRVVRAGHQAPAIDSQPAPPAAAPR